METKTKNKGNVDCWINEDSLVKKFVILAKSYYDGTLSFVRNGTKSYTAKLDPKKLKMVGTNECSEAYFDIATNKSKKKDVFFLRLVEGKNVNTIKIL